MKNNILLLILLSLSCGILTGVNGGLWTPLPYSCVPGNATVIGMFFVPFSAEDPAYSLISLQYFADIGAEYSIYWYTWDASVHELKVAGNISLNVSATYIGYPGAICLIDASVSSNGHPMLAIALSTELVVVDLWTLKEVVIAQPNPSSTTVVWFCPATPDLVYTHDASGKVYVCSISMQKQVYTTSLPGLWGFSQLLCIGDSLFMNSIYSHSIFMQWKVKDFISVPNTPPMYNITIPGGQFLNPISVPIPPTTALPTVINSFGYYYPTYAHGAFTIYLSDVEAPAVVSYLENVENLNVPNAAAPQQNIEVDDYTVVVMDQQVLATFQPFPIVVESTTQATTPFYGNFHSLVGVPAAARTTFPFSFFLLYSEESASEQLFSTIVPYKLT